MKVRRAKRKLTPAEADLLAMRLRRENMIAQHKAAMEEYKTRAMIEEAEKIKNWQNQYGSLLEASSRLLPLGLQGAAYARMRDLGNALTISRQKYPFNFPRGPDPSNIRAQQSRRRLA